MVLIRRVCWRTLLEELDMKKVWTKPAMHRTEAGFEISRYLCAEIKK